MNLALLDRADLEAIVLDPPLVAPTQLICSDNAIAEYVPHPATMREARLRHVLAAAHELARAGRSVLLAGDLLAARRQQQREVRASGFSRTGALSVNAR